MNIISNNYKINLSQFAKKHNISRETARKIARSFNAAKTREQYEKDAQLRRKVAYDLRQKGLKFREIAEQLNISVNNAQQLVRRYRLTS